MPLGPSDLVKSEIFKHLTKDLHGRDLELRNAQLTSDWQIVINNLEEGDVEQFLRHFLLSRQKGALTSKKVFDRVDQRINKSGLDAVDESQKLLDELLSSSKLYSYLLDNDCPDFTGEEDSLQLMQELSDSYRVFCLAVIDPRISLLPEQRVELIRLCEVVVVRWVMTGGNAQDLENLMQDMALGLRGGDTFEVIRTHLQSKMAADAKVAAAFEDTVESAALVRVVLYRINRRWDATNLINLDAKKIHVEHIAPDKATEHWLGVLFPNDDDTDRAVEYDAATELWGNKTILDSKINMEIKQKPFAEKREGFIETLPNGKIREYTGYSDSPLAITKDLGIHFHAWDRNLIAKRNKWIADAFLKIWTVYPNPTSIQTFSSWFREN